MIVFISGGAKSGKSLMAQHIARALSQGKHYYVATMLPADDEDVRRIERHLEERKGWGFETIECGNDILSCLNDADTQATFLVDSVTALLTNELFCAQDGFRIDHGAAKRCVHDLTVFAQSVGNAVVVSDYLGSDANFYDTGTETYRKYLAEIDRALAAISDVVIEACSNVPFVHKGELPFACKAALHLNVLSFEGPNGSSSADERAL